MKQTKQYSAQNDRQQFRDVAIEGWERGRTDFLMNREPFFHNPQTYFEKAYCLGYAEMMHADNHERFCEIANDGFEHGESDCDRGKELFFDDPQTYYEVGYYYGYTLRKRRNAEPENETREILSVNDLI